MNESIVKTTNFYVTRNLFYCKILGIACSLRETLQLHFSNVRSTGEFRDFVYKQRFFCHKLATFYQNESPLGSLLSIFNVQKLRVPFEYLKLLP